MSVKPFLRRTVVVCPRIGVFICSLRTKWFSGSCELCVHAQRGKLPAYLNLLIVVTVRKSPTISKMLVAQSWVGSNLILLSIYAIKYNRQRKRLVGWLVWTITLHFQSSIQLYEVLHWSDNWKWRVIFWHAWLSKIIILLSTPACLITFMPKEENVQGQSKDIEHGKEYTNITQQLNGNSERERTKWT